MSARGRLHLVSVGPGEPGLIPPRAERAIRASDAIVGYELYTRWIRDWIADKEIHCTPMTGERERVAKALELARAGRVVSLVSGGDIGVYAMAGLAFEMMADEDAFDVEVIPGITAATAAAARLGAPLTHDFATLSLSDHLCPWEWIEERARALAAAGLVVALYNVQSGERVDGLYRIARIFLEHRAPDTPCGVVRDAYREGETVRVLRLDEILSARFDMRTTVIVGNRFTQVRRGFLFTPRGYGAWEGARAAAGSDTGPPAGAVWVFSGTSDGNRLARRLLDAGLPVVISALTEYGGAIARETCPGAFILSGRLGVEARRRELRRGEARRIVDATHPYAETMSRQLIALSGELGIPYLRYERALGRPCPWAVQVEGPADALRRAAGRRIFLAIGSTDLAEYLGAEGASGREWFVRIAPDPSVLERALRLGIPRGRICALLGPVSRELNVALFRQWEIETVITRDSGEEGGFSAKAEAARDVGARLLVLRRPAMDYPNVCGNIDEAVAAVLGGEDAPGAGRAPEEEGGAG